MVLKNIQFASTPDVTLLEFGNGDIITSCIQSTTANAVPYGGLCFTNSAPHIIGTEHEDHNGKTTDDIQPQAIITFTKLESFDVVIERLQLARTQFAERLAQQA